MAFQVQAPDGSYINQTTSNEYQSPVGSYLNESVSTAATWKTTLGVTTAAGIKTVLALVLASVKADLGLTPR